MLRALGIRQIPQTHHVHEAATYTREEYHDNVPPSSLSSFLLQYLYFVDMLSGLCDRFQLVDGEGVRIRRERCAPCQKKRSRYNSRRV
jgi:hypothetical protein